MTPPTIVKFRVEFVGQEIPTDPRVEQLVAWCLRFDHTGLTPKREGTARCLGNLSFRLKPNSPKFIITGSTLSSKGGLLPKDFVTVIEAEAGRGVVRAVGVRDPSSESVLHYEIYKRRGDVGAIFHGHDREITALAPSRGWTETEHEEPAGTLGLVNEVIKVLDTESFLILRNHGFLSLGTTMEEAGERALTVKEGLANRRP